MGLEIINHLQLMFDVTQEEICGSQGIGRPLYYRWMYRCDTMDGVCASRAISS